MAASGSDSEEDFVSYGIPLEPFEEDGAIRKPVPIQEQTVKDEKGRFKRFHGAFTGGFSAGYFNTVGSKEGWTPSTFVSSRQQKADRQLLRPEDFMDEEDLGEHGIASKEITTTDDFSSSRKDEIRDKARAVASMAGPIPGDTLLEDLITPARTSIGVELLRKMGWKEGQGVGPRVKRKTRKQEADPGVKIYGCALPPDTLDNSEGEEDDYAPENVTFAPKDVTPIDFTSKDDLHGLGYCGLNPQQALLGSSGRGHIDLFSLGSDRMSSLLGQDRPRHNRRVGVSGQAFGVGALEEEDDDIYHSDSLTCYDSVIREETGDGLFGWTAPQEYTGKKKGSHKDVTYVGKILDGFTLASQPEPSKPTYPPPDLPRDFRPVHVFRPVLDVSSASPQLVQALQASAGQVCQGAQEKGRHELDAARRRELLGESALQGPSSVFDLLDSRDKERLAGIRQAAEGKTASMAPSQQALSGLSLPAGAEQALGAWHGVTADSCTAFRPFEQNPEKQARYDDYIAKLKNGQKDALDSSLDPRMTEWERGRERDEFVRAAMLYKPSSSTLACRFTRGRQEDGADTVEVQRDQENDASDKEAAVKMKMFGKLTRDTFEWHPDKLLCRRFNIPDPYPGSGSVGLPKVKRDKFSVFNFLTVTESSLPSARGAAPEASAQPASGPLQADSGRLPQPGRKSRWDVSSQSSETKDPLSELLSAARSQATAEKEVQASPAPGAAGPGNPDSKELKEEEEEEQESRPPMDLFKAIFASSSDEKSSSSSEDEDEEEDEVEPQEERAPGSVTQTPAPPGPPPGSQGIQAAPVENRPPARSSAQSQDSGPQDEEFGPKLPPPLPPGASSWTPPSAKEEKHKKKSREKHKGKKDHKHKKGKKHKKKRKKQKHKGKQKKRPAEEDSDSTDTSEGSDSDVEKDSGALSSEELLKRFKSLRGKK
ncbi:G patch domain-containing protein 1 isoform X1 [Lepisosteus oculatus]|uniref:G patch domain-containing protein 1 isoform X1 n=1 Tax=Lepisosteus oculatus TaxID=7918 RepID=UPI00073FE897|nr:PREDICTED: G patch domain-containing protein 1 isoform X1 [Lepisosteus oculatus]